MTEFDIVAHTYSIYREKEEIAREVGIAEALGKLTEDVIMRANADETPGPYMFEVQKNLLDIKIGHIKDVYNCKIPEAYINQDLFDALTERHGHDEVVATIHYLLNNQPIWRVQLNKSLGTLDKVYYTEDVEGSTVELAREEAQANLPNDVIVLSVRQATLDDLPELMG